ncbi:hypothetical protein [Leifsonia sp. NPDC058248]|uniref:hypothetical protein n=1 Tax=Leifsonia sp. NPDC058248 TaxID=3346402 RepID=UPI0036DE28E5
MAPMMVLGWIAITFAVVMLAIAVTVVVIARRIYLRIRRSRPLAGAVLRTRARFSYGPQQRVLRLRVRLQETLDSGQAAIDLAVRSEGPKGELPRLFRRIQTEGIALESQLRLMESERDSAVLAAELPVVTRRVDELTGLVRRLRSAVASGLGELSDDTLSALHSDVDREVAALHAGMQELHALNGTDGSPEPYRQQSTERLSRGNRS